MANGKRTRIKLESQIQRLLSNDNGVTSHFDYRVHLNSAKKTIELNLLTYNDLHNEFMLLHRVFGRSAIDCLNEMIRFLEESSFSKKDYSFTIQWKKKDSKDELHTSYFVAKTEREAKEKFLHGKKEEEYEFTIHKKH